jgi:sulfate/thiosulfate transport system substrate-binding protein
VTTVITTVTYASAQLIFKHKDCEMKKVLAILLLAFVLSASVTQAQDAPITLTLGGYTTPREAYAEIIPLFQAYWREQHGQEVVFQESYLGSGAQSRAVAGGFEADVVALSLANDVTKLVDAGLITHDWTDTSTQGFVSTSLVALIVRPGNPLGIQDWADLTRDDVEVITPDPATSGGAQWNVLAAYGAALRGHVPGYEATDAGAFQFLVDVFSNVSVMDPGARESVITYANGIGDVLITYENEYYAGVAAGDQYDIVYPSSTILIENPVAVMDSYAAAHGTQEVAQAFVEFLFTPAAQAIFAAHGFRPPIVTDETAAESTAEATEIAASFWPEGALDPEKFPAVPDIFTVAQFGGWPEIGANIFSDDGIFTQVLATTQQ